MNIVFLDFDGVLATDDHDDFLLAEGKNVSDYFGRKFSPKCIDALRFIVDATGAEIVITSSWRMAFSLLKMKLMWKVRKMPGKIRGYTPCAKENRGNEIDIWLSRHRCVQSYVILDDMDSRQFNSSQKQHLVTCNHFSGISMEDALEAVKILESDFIGILNAE